MDRWSEEERDRAFLIMTVMAKNLEFMSSIKAITRKQPDEAGWARFCETVLAFTGFLSETFKGSDGMIKELTAFCAQLGIELEVRQVNFPPKGAPPN